MNATTVYVTHDQLEAMQMGDKIVVMNNAVVEQFGTPQQIYDTPATMFVADFIGSPSMNFLRFEGALENGATRVDLNGQMLAVPKQLQGASGKLVFGVRPEHVSLSENGDYRGKVLTTEYLGTTQIITLDTPNGELKARIDSAQTATVGENVALNFEAPKITLFDETTGLALRSSLNREVLAHG
jgi:multiple sugar transport system ATP-binding protein